ncbi:hypothetical protein EF888_07310 [Silicimonas algicola]|uniref:Uncharacterized protein n=1 Tax=Silicimonas algicola TaxID=1826607 RepID=A0A316G4M1_9RHOB|nr:hypothetical protein [Silicimonas algicola]AZQ66960.1 hypothetical protein EF888_07310 [Silicimonas algicola]PWK55532.1 hypothetical protein C8D95_107198 [Silicimonas algicola]
MTSTLSRHMKPAHKAASRALGYALTLDDMEGWEAFSALIEARLSERERAGLAFAALRSQSETHAAWTAEAAVNDVAPPEVPTILDTPTGRAVMIEWREKRDAKERREVSA